MTGTQTHHIHTETPARNRAESATFMGLMGLRGFYLKKE